LSIIDSITSAHIYFVHKYSSVRELMGRVRNVLLIKCTLDLGKPKKGWDFEREGTWARGEMGELVYKQPGTEVDDSCHS
jgi:hypothetical protein